MDKFERFKIDLLGRAQVVSDALHIQTHQLSTLHQIEEKYVRELLLNLHAEKFIRLSAWDGSRDKPLEEWPDANYFFNDTSERSYKRIRLLVRGAQLLGNLPKPLSGPEPKPPIGFAP
jgi:hypothetical protein